MPQFSLGVRADHLERCAQWQPLFSLFRCALVVHSGYEHDEVKTKRLVDVFSYRSVGSTHNLTNFEPPNVTTHHESIQKFTHFSIQIFYSVE